MSTETMIAWAQKFADEFLRLADGQAVRHDLLDWAYELFPARGAEPADAVARAEFHANRG